MSNIAQFITGRIKSIQRGSVDITPVSGSVVTGTITITSVNTAKTLLTSNCKTGTSYTTGVAVTPSAGCTLTNATTISYALGAGTLSNTGGTLYWQVVEYY